MKPYTNKDFGQDLKKAYKKSSKKTAAPAMTMCKMCKTSHLPGKHVDMKSSGTKKKALTTKTRKALPTTAFALPNRRYPIHDKAHARNALARVAQNGSPAEKAKVRAAVKRKFPSIA